MQSLARCSQLLGTVLGASLIASTAFGQAAPTDVVVFRNVELDGYNAGYAPQNPDGRPRAADQRGAGIEHIEVATCGTKVLMVGVGSYDKPGLDPSFGERGGEYLQTIAVAADITANGLLMGPAKYIFPELNDSDDDRDGMKPTVECLDADLGLFVVDANSPKNNPNGNDECRDWATVVGLDYTEDGLVYPVQLTDAKPVLANNNDDCSDKDEGALHVTKLSDGNYQVNLIGSCNGNGDDVAWHTKFNVVCTNGTNCSIESDYSPNNEDSYKVQVSQGEIERFRPVTYQIPGSNRMLVLGTEGDNQPPRYGISATVVDMDSLEPISSVLIAEAYTRNNQEVLSTMPHAARLGTGADGSTRFLVSYQTRIGRRRKGDKGATILNVGLLQATAEGEVSWMIPPEEGVFPGLSATHHTMCETSYGNINEEVKPAAVLLTTSFQGGSSARATIITYDEVNNVIEHEMTVAMNVRHDNALVSNMYGNNPTQEGKNSQYCTRVENPGYGDPSSFAPDVQEFMLFPAAERRVAENLTVSEKLALSVAMVPTVFNGPETPVSTPIDEVDPVAPEDPEDPIVPVDPVDPEPTEPTPEEPSEPASPATPTDGAQGLADAPESPSALEVEPSAIDSQGGCAAVPTSAPLLMLSLAAFLRRRRRNNH